MELHMWNPEKIHILEASRVIFETVITGVVFLVEMLNYENKKNIKINNKRDYQEGLVGTLTEGWVIWAVDWCLTGEFWVELTDIFSWLLEISNKGGKYE